MMPSIGNSLLGLHHQACLLDIVNFFFPQVQGMHSDAATLRKASILREASRIVHEEGFRAFWKGNLVTIAHRLPYSSVNFYAYEQYKKVGIDIVGINTISVLLVLHFIVITSFFMCSSCYIYFQDYKMKGKI